MNQSLKLLDPQDQSGNHEAPVPPPMPQVHRGTDGNTYAVVDGRSVRIDSAEFRRIARYDLLAVGEDLPSSDQVRAYLDQLLARAHRLPPEPTYLRVCQLADRIIYDLANEAGEVVEIGADGCRVLEQSPVRFVRPAGTEAMPTPQFGRGYADLRRFIRLPEPAFSLFVAHLTYQFCDGAPQPIMVLAGEQGRAKTTVAKMVQMIADPRQPAVRQLPPSCRDLMVSARHTRVMNYDNVSVLKPALSDTLCSLSTGGGYGIRTGHTDTEETRFDALRPIVLGGIGTFVVRDDLRDRCVFYELEAISESDRLAEGPLWHAFRTALPGIVGGLFELCGQALATVGSVTPGNLPRMADFYRWSLAVQQAAGWADGTIDAAYRDQRAASDVDAMEADLVIALVTLLNNKRTWSGPAKLLLEDLQSLPGPVTVPRSPAKLGSELQRIAPLLRRNGISIENHRTGAARKITLTLDMPSLLSLPSSGAPAISPESTRDDSTRPAVVAGNAIRGDSGDGSDGSDGSPATTANVAGEQRQLGAPAEPDGSATSATAAVDADFAPEARVLDDEDNDIDEEDNEPAPATDDMLDGEVASVRPPVLRPIYRVLKGKTLSADDVLAELRKLGQDDGKTLIRVRKLLVLGTDKHVFRRVERGNYTC